MLGRVHISGNKWELSPQKFCALGHLNGNVERAIWLHALTPSKDFPVFSLRLKALGPRKVHPADEVGVNPAHRLS